MVVNRRFLYWGVFFVTVGAVILVAQSDVIGREGVAQAWRLWPVLVIALGIGLLVRHTRFGVAGGMLAAATPGLLLGGLLVTAPQITPECRIVQPASFATRQGSFDGPASVDLKLACGDVAVMTTAGSGWQLETGISNGTTPTVDVTAGRLSVRSSNQVHSFGLPWGGDTWRVTLPTSSQLDMTAEVSAGRGRFDLAGARFGRLDMTVNAGDVRVDLTGATVARLVLDVNAADASMSLPSGGDISADFTVNAGKLAVCAPSDLGLRIHQHVVLGATSYTGLVHNGDAWESPDYAFAIHHADVTMSVNVGSVDVNPVGGCK